MNRFRTAERAGTAEVEVPVIATEEGELRAMPRGGLHLGCRETPDRVVLRFERLEHGQQLRDGQQIGDALRQVQQLEAAALPADGRVRAHDLAEARAGAVR